MYRVLVQVIDDSVFTAGQDDPRVVKTLDVGCSYRKQAIAERLAVRAAEIINVNEPRITGKRRNV